MRERNLCIDSTNTVTGITYIWYWSKRKPLQSIKNMVLETELYKDTDWVYYMYNLYGIMFITNNKSKSESILETWGEKYLAYGYTVIFPDGIDAFDDSVLSGDDWLKEVVLPKSLKWMDSGCFCSCDNFEKVNIPDSLSYIGTNSFERCPKLPTETIEKIESIKNTNQE